MNSKEAIRNRILTYINLIWGTNKLERLDITIRLMVEELTNELYLIQNNLKNIDRVLLDRLAFKLTPPIYMAVRPAHTVFHLQPVMPEFILKEPTPFLLNKVPEKLANKGVENITFHPVTDTKLFDIHITELFQCTNLFSIDNTGKKKVKAVSQEIINPRSIWLGLKINKEIEDLKGLSFYVDFPELSEIHENYEVMPYTELIINGQSILLEQGFPGYTDMDEDESEFDLLSFYKNNYLTIAQNLQMANLKAEILPEELALLFDADSISDLVPRFWIQLTFHYYILPEHMNGIVIAINTFPVSNKIGYYEKVSKDNFEDATSLLAGREEVFLEIGDVVDSINGSYRPHNTEEEKLPGVYRTEIVKRTKIKGYDIVDYLEKLMDLVHSEKVAFPTIDKDTIAGIIHSIDSLDEDAGNKIGINEKSKQSTEIGYILLSPFENTNYVNIHYWCTHGELVNGIPASEHFAPQIANQSNGTDAISLTEVLGGKEFSDLESLLAVNKYILTSNDRLVTEDNIVSFCEIELGKAVGKIELELTVRDSPKPGQGMIRTIEVRLFPSERFPELLQQKGILRNLLMRMKKRSPNDYDYTIKIMPLEKGIE